MEQENFISPEAGDTNSITFSPASSFFDIPSLGISIWLEQEYGLFHSIISLTFRFGGTVRSRGSYPSPS